METQTFGSTLHLYMPIVWKILIAYGIVLLAIAADLWSGIRKARAKEKITGKKVFVHTYGLDRTLDKLRKRYNLISVFSLIDALIILSELHDKMIPYATFVCAVVMCLVELKSIMEKDEDKGRYIEATKMAAEMWKGINKDELADVIIKKLKEEENSNGNKESLN